MAINGISSYGMSYYNYQATINNYRLAQALSNNPRYSEALSSLSNYSSKSVSYKDSYNSLNSSMDFIKRYSNSMSDLMSSANALRSVNQSGALSNLAVTSSDTSVATVTERLPVRDAKNITLGVQQLARAQTNSSNGVKASGMAQSDMNFTVGNVLNSVNVQVSATDKNGSFKSNYQMLNEAADQINRSSSQVRATVTQKDGVASLQLEGKSTGEAHTFNVSGELGAAAGLDKVETEAANALYSVTSGGKTTQHESYSNDIYVDSVRIGAELKGVGQTNIRADVDSEKVASAISDLVASYNSSLKLLNDNYDRGTGVEKQLRNLVMGLGSEQSLEYLGITVNKDATLNFDESVFAKNMKDDPSFTKSLISGAGGIANTAFSKASSGMSVNSSSLINGDLESFQSSLATNQYNVFAMYSRGGGYNLNNYAAVGMMLNYLV